MASESITRPEAKRRLYSLIDDLARHVDYLREIGVTEVACAPQIASARQALLATPQNAAKSQPKRDKDMEGGRPLPPLAAATVEHPTLLRPSASEGRLSNIEHRIEESDAATMPGADADAELKAIAREVAACKKCVLHEKRRQAVPGQGRLHPDILFIGEGPGEDEDKQGLAFVGRAGQMLTRLIVRMGYTRDEVFIANIVKCRPPNNRKPLPEEMNMCRPYLERQIAVLKPKTIVLLGASAFEGLLLPKTPGMTISRMRGKWLEYQGIPAMPTFHPSYLLRNPAAMWDVWNDMQLVLTHLGRTPPPAPAKGK